MPRPDVNDDASTNIVDWLYTVAQYIAAAFLNTSHG